MKIFGNHSNESDSTHDKHLSIKGQCFIGGGVGLSTILFYVYSIRVKSEEGSHGTSQSLVYNGFLDYGISDNLTLGAAIAYQSASGVIAAPTSIGSPEPIEDLSRTNVSVRILENIISTKRINSYWGFRFGASFWTDAVTPTIGPNSGQPTLGKYNSITPSLQILLGVRSFYRSIGYHVELALGTPYFLEGGITVKIGKKT